MTPISSHAAEPTIFDVYRWGIHSHTLTVEDDTLYTLREKDLAANAWGKPVTLTAEALPGNRDFLLPGTIAAFPAQYASLTATQWGDNAAVGWPNADQVYERHKELTARVDGGKRTAWHWAARDASNPMDLIIGEEGAIIAAMDVREDQVVVRRGYEGFTTVGRWRDPLMAQPQYGYRALDLAMVPARDGDGLATRVYLPEGDIRGPFPTIFVRTPYGITDPPRIDLYQQYAIRGYAVVLQAAGGTIYWDPASQSEGEWEMMVQEPGDGAAALEWIVDQPWSNGDVCMQGGSYVGYTQWALTKARNPALKCIIPEVSMGTAFSDQPYMGGTFVQGLAYYVLYMTDRELLPGRTWTDVMRHRPIADIDRYATGEDIPLWNRFFEHWRNDSYWDVQDWYAGDHARRVATLQISGWFDDDYPGTRSNWALMERYGTRANRLILGPWKHGYNADRQLNGYSFGADALRDDIWLLKQRWHDYHLNGVRNGVTDPRVEYFVLGDNTWRTARHWPPRSAQPTPFYLQSSGVAHRHPADGRLAPPAPQSKQKPETYVYDPANPVRNWYSFDLMDEWADMQSFPYDFRDVETRGDVVTYTTPVLEEDVTIAGNIKLVLYASTDVKDTDWWAYIADVAPDNSSNRLSVGVLRARFRNLEDTDYHVFGSNFEQEELLSGAIDDVVRYEISIPSVANTFKKGHRIRLAIMNAHDNYAFPNSNTGGEEGYVTDTVPGTMVIHHSPGAASHVVLPLVD